MGSLCGCVCARERTRVSVQCAWCKTINDRRQAVGRDIRCKANILTGWEKGRRAGEGAENVVTEVSSLNTESLVLSTPPRCTFSPSASSVPVRFSLDRRNAWQFGLPARRWRVWLLPSKNGGNRGLELVCVTSVMLCECQYFGLCVSCSG